jgi:hypothetical protein
MRAVPKPTGCVVTVSNGGTTGVETTWVLTTTSTATTTQTIVEPTTIFITHTA